MDEQGENNTGLPGVGGSAAAPFPEAGFLRMNPLGFVILALAAIFFLYQVVGGGITLLLFGQSITSDNVQWMRVATMLAQVVFLLIPTLILMKIQHGSTRPSLPWKGPKATEFLLAAIGVFSLQQVMEGTFSFRIFRCRNQFALFRDSPQNDRGNLHDAGSSAFTV